MPINRPNDLFMGAGQATPQGLGQAPQGALPAGQTPPGQGQRQGMNPGGIEAVKAGIKALQRAGLEIEQIIKAILKLAEQLNLNIPEEEMRQLIEQTAAESGEELPPQKGIRNKVGMGVAAAGKMEEIGEF